MKGAVSDSSGREISNGGKKAFTTENTEKTVNVMLCSGLFCFA